MKTILFPTDFSMAAENAIDFALGFAQIMDARLVLLHVHTLPSPIQDIVDAVVDIKAEADENAIKTAEANLSIFQDLFVTKQKTDFNNRLLPAIKSEILQGEIAETIVEVAKRELASLIIMGDKTVSTFIGKLITQVSSTYSSQIALQAPCPVLLVPPSATYHPVKHILYAAELGSQEDEMLNEALQFAQLLKAEMEVVHIENRKKELADNRDETMDELEKEFGNYENITFKKIIQRDVVNGLKSYLETQKPDLLVLSNRKRPYHESVYHESVTEKFAFETDIPLLVLHQG